MALSLNGTSGISGVDGSAGTPALQGSDTNTGISFGTDTVNINTGGTTRATVDSSGRVLVGTSSARSNFLNAGLTSKLQIEGTTGTDSWLSVVGNNNSAGGEPILLFGKTRGTSTGSNTVVQSGDILGQIVFQGADGTDFVQAASIGAYSDATPGADDMPGRLVFSTTKDGASSPSERLRIDNLGRTSINQTSATDFGALNVTYNSTDSSNQPATGVNITQSNANTGTMMGFRNSAGTVIGTITNNNNGTITYNNSSDYRLKENIVDLDGAIERLQSIPVRRFNFIGFPDKTVDGFVAHEIQSVVPEAVTGEKDAEDDNGNPIYQGIDQSKLVPLLTAALQEAIAKIESLETRLTALEGGTNP